MKYTIGSELPEATKREVLSAYGYRWTIENEARARQWHGAGTTPPQSLPTDAAWLADHAFATTRSGRLNRSVNHSFPAFMALREAL